MQFKVVRIFAAGGPKYCIYQVHVMQTKNQLYAVSSKFVIFKLFTYMHGVLCLRN